MSTAERMATLVPDDQDQQALLGPVETSAVAAASLGWRQEPEAWQRALGRLSETASRLEGGVEIVEQSPTTVISSRVNLPVQIRNSLSVPVTVEVQLRSGSLRLVPESSVEKTIAPGTQDSVTLPVTAAASGDTSVTAFLTNSQGQPIGGEVPLRVRVRADWEGRGVAVAAGVAGLVFVGGIVRTVVRVRRRPAPPVVRSAEEAQADGPPTRRPEEPPRG